MQCADLTYVKGQHLLWVVYERVMLSVKTTISESKDHCLPVFPCSHNYPYLLSALPKCSCPFSCSLTSFKLPLFPCSPIEIDHVPWFPTLSYCLGSLDKYDSLRSSWLDYTRTTCPLCDLLIFVRASCSVFSRNYEQNDLVFSLANASTNL